MKAAVVYWSGTGNTAAMADLVLEGMKSAGADADLIACNSVTDLSAYDAIAFGCPAMGCRGFCERIFLRSGRPL